MSDSSNAQPNLLQQYPLALKLDRETTFDNFWPNNHLELIAAAKGLVDKPTGGWLYLAGSSGSGVSHLLQAVSNYADAKGLSTLYLNLAEMLSAMQLNDSDVRKDQPLTALFESLESFDLLCIDDIDYLGQTALQYPQYQEQLFYLLVRLQQLPVSRLVFGAKNIASKLGLQLPDLRSRLALASVFHVHYPSDEDKQKILQFRGQRLGLSVSDEVARFIVQRCSRDMHNLINRLDLLDTQAMAESRKLTIPLVKKVFSI